MDIYNFKENYVYSFSRHIHAMTRRKGDELFFRYCPYCQGGDKKDKETFSINIKTGQFKCFRSSCGITGNMITLAKDFDFSIGNEADEYYNPKKQFRVLPQLKEHVKPKPEAIRYLESRGISKEVAENYEITVKTEDLNVLVFPFFDENGVIQFIKYRKTDFDKKRDKNKEWCEENCKPILFGMKQCNDFSRLIMCEGQLDSLSVATAEINNAVSVPNGCKGFTWIPYCWDWINKFSEIVVFGDYENGVITLLDDLKKRLKMTIKHVREEDYKDCKDANEILQKYGKEQVRSCVENAVIVPIKKVIQLSDVEDVDIFKIQKLKTGIRDLDRLLYGGLPFSGVVLVSGKRGQGKSTFTSQLLINAIYQNYKCFTYSGELANATFKAWMGFQIAGREHIIEYQNQWGDSCYNIPQDKKQMISEWYRDRCFLYDNSDIDGDEKESLIELIESVITQYGVKFILIDNLMTALDLEIISDNDKYEKQSIFVKRLARIGLKYDVLIILVAHKRKNNFSNDENDEISGSGDISNLATVTISYDKNNEIEPSQRLLKVSKNRLFGKTNTKGFVMDYDEKSKRVYGEGDDLDFDYGWYKGNKKFIQINEETPFE